MIKDKNTELICTPNVIYNLLYACIEIHAYVAALNMVLKDCEEGRLERKIESVCTCI